LEAFRQELSKLGWVEGKNIAIEYRFGEQKSERLPELVAELVRLKVDLILVSGAQAASAAKNVTTTIPIVMATAADPVGGGLIASAAGRQRHWAHGFRVRANHQKERYSRTQSPSSPELDHCGCREPT
jgi:ABC-type uncharacterized transport system substrate-binding protein